jgi:predicted transcriptional regulator YheO
VQPDDLVPGDVPLEWEGEVVGGIRLAPLTGELDRLVQHIEEELGGKLEELARAEKQAAIRMLDERGAFQLRKSIEDVATRMGVSRITIYNYLNVIRDE